MVKTDGRFPSPVTGVPSRVVLDDSPTADGQLTLRTVLVQPHARDDHRTDIARRPVVVGGGGMPDHITLVGADLSNARVTERAGYGGWPPG